MPMHLEKILKESPDGVATFQSLKMEEAYSNSFEFANKDLHASAIDDTLSGTTGITAVIIGDMLYVGNVGDSRAIIASFEDGKLVSKPLSSDQTPYRKDERERIKKRVRLLSTAHYTPFTTSFTCLISLI